MFFSNAELKKRAVKFDLAFPPGEIDFFDQRLRQLTPLESEGFAEQTENGLGDIHIQGRLKVTMEAECDRCLEPARFPVESAFDLIYRPAAPVHTHHPAQEIQIGDEESELSFYEGEGLELKDVLREHLLLSMPMQRVCSQACLGICPVCGQNRNISHCDCEIKSMDDRWSALRKLNTRGA